MEMLLSLVLFKSMSRISGKSCFILYEGRFQLSTTHEFEISIRDGWKFDDTEKFTNLDFIFNFVDITFVIVREHSASPRFISSVNVLEVNMESEPESNNGL